MNGLTELWEAVQCGRCSAPQGADGCMAGVASGLRMSWEKGHNVHAASELIT